MTTYNDLQNANVIMLELSLGNDKDSEEETLESDADATFVLGTLDVFNRSWNYDVPHLIGEDARQTNFEM